MPERSRRPIVLGLVALALLAAAGFGVSGGIASSQPATTPASAGSAHQPGRRAETPQQCRTTLASLQKRANDMRKLRSNVLAKRTYLYTIGRVQGHPLFVPISRTEFGYFITEKLVLGEITSKEAVQAVNEIKQMTAENLVALNGYISTGDSTVQKQRNRCAALGGSPTSTAPKPPSSGPAFTLQPSTPSDVSNTHKSELTIDAAGMTAHFDNSRSGSAVWKIDYSWEVPKTITPGKSIQITLHDEFLSVTPSQPLGDQMNALAPDFAQAIQAHWPDNPDVSKTFTVPIPADLKDSKEMTITIGFVSSGVTYHYTK